MAAENNRLHLPEYDHFIQSIDVLALEISGSELHGMMCGFLCAGEDNQGEAYMRALLNNRKDEESRAAILSMFAVYSVSQQQINNFDFQFEMMLPDDNTSLTERAQAFSEWCEGFTQGLIIAGVDGDQFYDEEAQEALEHLTQFADLDIEAIDVDEEDEKALLEVSEYARMAVIRLHNDLVMNERERGGQDTTH